MHHFISAYYNYENNTIYPVKITIQERMNGEGDTIYMIAVVGNYIVNQMKKEGLPTLRIPDESGTERSHGELPSFELTLTDLISKFNNRTTIFIKNMPDGLLTKEQVELKKDVLIKDVRKEGYIVDREFNLLKVTADAVYSKENRIVIPNVINSVAVDAFSEININNIKIYLSNKEKIAFGDLISGQVYK